MLRGVTFRSARMPDLDALELYDIMTLRQRVFVVEQKCAYLDADGRDKSALHVLGVDQGTLVAYLRILPRGVRFAEPSIGRVCVHEVYRGSGLGRALVREGLDALFSAEGQPVAVALSAQAHLEPFYESLGWSRTSNVYDEDGIPHLDMVRAAVS